jgi:hypothetical protein
MSTLLTVQAISPVPLSDNPPTVTVDLSPLGGPSDAAMVDDGTGGDQTPGDGTYSLQTTVDPDAPNGITELVVTFSDRDGRPVHTPLEVGVVPAQDLYLYGDELGEEWNVYLSKADMDPSSIDYVQGGEYAQALILEGPYSSVDYSVEDDEGLTLFGYGTLEFWINPGTATIEELKITFIQSEGTNILALVEDWGLSLEAEQWQHVSIPLEVVFEGATSVQLKWLRFSGKVEGMFYLDDVRFVPEEAEPIDPEPVAVEASEVKAIPSDYALQQNVPNPFNPITIIAYDLPEASDVALTIYSITGQTVASLVSAHQEAGHYGIVWDGSGLASGVYLYRLEADSFVETKRMVLLR